MIPKHILLVLVVVAGACTQQEPCHEDLASIKNQTPVAIDTAILYDPKTFEESCLLTRFYRSQHLRTDSSYQTEETVINLTRIDDCFKILSVTEPGVDCN